MRLIQWMTREASNPRPGLGTDSSTGAPWGPPSTILIRAARALQRPCGQDCVNWATAMLDGGSDTPHLRMLAGMAAPFNHFEIAATRDRVLEELGIEPDDRVDPSGRLAADLLRAGLAGELDMREALACVKDLCVAAGHRSDLLDFYRLHFAQEDLRTSSVQFYWDGATPDNIDRIIRERAQAFVDAGRQDA